VADPRTGATTQRRVPGGTFCHGPLHVIGDRVVLSAARGRHPIALSLPLTLTGPGRSLGAAETFTASSTPGRAWIGHWERSRVWRSDERVLGSLREVDAEGRVVARTTLRMPAWGSLEAVVDGAFLLSHEGRLSLRRPGAATRRVRDDWVVAAGASRIASCRSDCRRLRIWGSDDERALHLPAGIRPAPGWRAAFSPDGTRLAAPVRARGRDRVAVIDLASGSWRLIPGRLAGYRAVAWSPSGRWLYFTGPRDRLLAWSGGRAVRLPIDTGGTVMSIASTPLTRAALPSERAR
jgi:hypothetical protein